MRPVLIVAISTAVDTIGALVVAIASRIKYPFMTKRYKKLPILQ
jgi:hypothetical protein